ncbi:MAG: restriction endonuclease subunit S, partial [Firmicutes bacterium]|nr:restriction endonuclease subunit S [Bacillota bacterium]
TGKSFVLRNCPAKSVFASYLIRVRPDKTMVDPIYLSYYFRTQDYWDQITGAANGSTQPGVNASNLKQLKIPLLPLSEQKRITAILDKADAVRRKRQETIRLLDEFLRSVFLEMFGDPVRNEKGWEKSKIGELTKVETGSTPSRDIKEYYDNGNIPWVKTSEVQNNYIVKCEEYITEQALKETNCKVLPEDTILIAMYGQGQTRGRVGYMEIKGATNQACAAILPSELINSLFLYYQLRFRYMEIRNMGRGGNQPNLNLSMIKDFMILYPPITLQEKFTQIAEKVTKQQALFNKSLVKIENSFNSLMQKAFRGEL